MSAEPPPLKEQLARLSSLVDDQQHPNINALWQIAKDIEGIKLNLKVFGYELALRLRAARPIVEPLAAPSRVGLSSKPCTQADMETAWMAYWASRLGINVIYHRKIWELCYVLQALWEHGVLSKGARGLGFGCGQEPIPSLLAAMECYITMTDLPPEEARAKGWLEPCQHASRVEHGLQAHLVERSKFLDHVSHAYVDMNAIPDTLRDFDFCWSICSLEHLGSIAKGLAFVENSLQTLRPGGIAVHTTEFNFWNDETTIDNWPTVLFQRKHFVSLAERLESQGHNVAKLDFNVGNAPMDRFIDLPPYDHDLVGPVRQSWRGHGSHLKLMLDGFPCTCFGLIITKAAA